VVLSNDAKHYYQKWFPNKPIEVVYNTRDIEPDYTTTVAFQNDIVELKNQFSIIGANGELTKRKGIELLIDALPHLPNHALVIVGNGKERKNLEQQAFKNGVANRCMFLGYQKNAHRYLRYYDIYAMASRAEGFPLALLEAARYKKNTICSNIPLFQELFTPDEVTFFELENTPSLVDAVISASRADKGQQLHDTCSDKYSIINFVESYQNVYAAK
jgi:glycosyltransferase involved in cell wall biosynthesis